MTATVADLKKLCPRLERHLVDATFGFLSTEQDLEKVVRSVTDHPARYSRRAP